MAGRERMDSVDTTWLRLDRPANPMIIVGLITLAGPVDVERLEQTLSERLLSFRRFQLRFFCERLQKLGLNLSANLLYDFV